MLFPSDTSLFVFKISYMFKQEQRYSSIVPCRPPYGVMFTEHRACVCFTVSSKAAPAGSCGVWYETKRGWSCSKTIYIYVYICSPDVGLVEHISNHTWGVLWRNLLQDKNTSSSSLQSDGGAGGGGGELFKASSAGWWCEWDHCAGPQVSSGNYKSTFIEFLFFFFTLNLLIELYIESNRHFYPVKHSYIHTFQHILYFYFWPACIIASKHIQMSSFINAD